MTEQEILACQEASGNTEFFLILIGRFLHAYGNGAFALARITGYHVRRKQRKAGEVLVLGFPVDLLQAVRDKVREAGGDMESVDAKTWMFRGVDGTPDLSMVSEPTVYPASSPAPLRGGAGGEVGNWLADEVRRFDLSSATPIDAMLFLANLKQRLMKQA